MNTPSINKETRLDDNDSTTVASSLDSSSEVSESGSTASGLTPRLSNRTSVTRKFLLPEVRVSSAVTLPNIFSLVETMLSLLMK